VTGHDWQAMTRGEQEAYANGYVDGVRRRLDHNRQQWWDGYAQALEDLLGQTHPTEDQTGRSTADLTCDASNVVRLRPLPGRKPRPAR
jgi:hypothetical protein